MQGICTHLSIKTCWFISSIVSKVEETLELGKEIVILSLANTNIKNRWLRKQPPTPLVQNYALNTHVKLVTSIRVHSQMILIHFTKLIKTITLYLRQTNNGSFPSLHYNNSRFHLNKFDNISEATVNTQTNTPTLPMCDKRLPPTFLVIFISTLHVTNAFSFQTHINLHKLFN